MTSLVGYTGFVGSNLYNKGHFDKVYNSKNITESFGSNPDLLIFAGLPAEKYLANNDPGKDMKQVMAAQDNICRINPKKLVLISTIDVFKEPNNVDETSPVNLEGLHAYGHNRYVMECNIRNAFSDALIIRLPGLYGTNIKKNFIYDYINVIPFMIKKDKMDELLQSDSSLSENYELMENGFYKLKEIPADRKEDLKTRFKELGFSALNFTDSRSKFQFYDLSRLYDDIMTALKNDILLWHPATEPVSAKEIYQYLSGKDFNNKLDAPPADYDYKTIHCELFGGKDGYICNKDSVLEGIKNFVNS